MKLINYKIQRNHLLLNLKVNPNEFLYNFEMAGDFNFLERLKQQISILINKNNINFKKGKVSLLINGVLMTTIVFAPTISSKNKTHTGTNDQYYSQIIDDSYNGGSTDFEITIDEPSNNISNSHDSPDDVIIDEDISLNETKDTAVINKSDAIVVNVMSQGSELSLTMQTYLIGVVAGEMPASYNLEALKAQAVAARTYALKRVLAGKSLTDDTTNQVYKDEAYLRNLWKNDYDKYYAKISKSIYETSNQIVVYNNKVIDALFHARNSGYTELPENVWVSSLPYLKSFESKYDARLANNEKNTFFSFEDLSKKLGVSIDINTDIALTISNTYVQKVALGSTSLKGTTVKARLGLNATSFTITKTDTGINFKTLGYGHGVGMSQSGANEMAKDNLSYIDILSFYYKGTNIVDYNTLLT